MADELIRFGKIRSFFFKPKQFLSFQKTQYNLKENEIILLENILNDSYFENLKPGPYNQYINKHETYDSVQPDKSVFYSNIIDLREDHRPNKKCIQLLNIKGNFWKKEMFFFNF